MSLNVLGVRDSHFLKRAFVWMQSRTSVGLLSNYCVDRNRRKMCEPMQKSSLWRLCKSIKRNGDIDPNRHDT